MKYRIHIITVFFTMFVAVALGQTAALELSLLKGSVTVAGKKHTTKNLVIPLPSTGEVIVDPLSKAVVRQKGGKSYVTLSAGKSYKIAKLHQFLKANGTSSTTQYLNMIFREPLNTEIIGSGAAGPSRGGEESMPYSPSENAMLLGDTIRLQWSNSSMVKPAKILVIGIADTVYVGDATNGQLAIHIEKPGTYQWRLESRKGLEVYSSSFIKLNADDAGKWRDRMAVFIKESGTKDPDIQNLIKQAFLEENNLVE